MIEGIDLITDLLSSLSGVNRFTFQIRDDKGNTVFSSSPDGCPPPASPLVKDLAHRVITSGGYAEELAEERLVLGVPVAGGREAPDCLLLIHERNVSDGDTSTHAGELKPLLQHLKALIEQQVAIQQETERLTEELDRSYEDLYIFSRIATQIKTLRFSGSMLEELVQELVETMRADIAIARLSEEATHNVVIQKPAIAAKLTDIDAFTEALVERVPRSAPSVDENCYIVNDSTEIEAFQTMAEAPFRLMAVKVRNGETDYGWLFLISFNMKEIFRRSEYRLLSSMAEQVALVLSNSELYQDLESFVINMVKSLVHAIEAKDVYTRGHSERVSRLSLMIADRINLDKNLRDALQWASILHDIGKIGTPERVLNKPGKLTDEEYTRIKAHPTKGADILEPIRQLSDAIPGVLYHHERFDGRGYPSGLKGDDIPLIARIIGVADTFDAMTSTRAYRKSRSSSQAMSVIRECAGTQLDPQLVDAFVDVMQQYDNAETQLETNG